MTPANPNPTPAPAAEAVYEPSRKAVDRAIARSKDLILQGIAATHEGYVQIKRSDLAGRLYDATVLAAEVERLRAEVARLNSESLAKAGADGRSRGSDLPEPVSRLAAGRTAAATSEPMDVTGRRDAHSDLRAQIATLTARAEDAEAERDRYKWRLIVEGEEPDGNVLVCIPSMVISGEAYFLREGERTDQATGWWWANTAPDDYYADEIVPAPTHWMPMPAPLPAAPGSEGAA